MAKLRQYAGVAHTVRGAPKSRRERRLWWTPYPNLHNSNPKVKTMNSDNSRLGYAYEVRQDSVPRRWAPPIALNSPEKNAYGRTRMDMVRGHLGNVPAGKSDAEIRQAFCNAYAQEIGVGLTFDADDNPAGTPLYFESRFREWKADPKDTRQDSAGGKIETRYDVFEF